MHAFALTHVGKEPFAIGGGGYEPSLYPPRLMDDAMKQISWLLLFLTWMVPTSCPAEEVPADKLVIQAKIPRSGDFMGFGFDSLWMMSGRHLVRVNAADNSIMEIDVKGSGHYRAIGVGEGAVWVPASSQNKLLKIDPIENRVVQEIPAPMFSSEGSIGIGEGGIWVLTAARGGDADLTRFNPAMGTIDAKIPLPANSAGVVVDFGSVWVTGYSKSELYRIDPKTNSLVSTIKLRDHPLFIASGENSIWVLNQGDGTVQRVDGKTGALIATIETGLSGNGGQITSGGGYVWIAMLGTPLGQIDPKTNTLFRVFKGGAMGDAICFGAGSLWVSGSAIHRIEPPR